MNGRPVVVCITGVASTITNSAVLVLDALMVAAAVVVGGLLVDIRFAGVVLTIICTIDVVVPDERGENCK